MTERPGTKKNRLHRGAAPASGVCIAAMMALLGPAPSADAAIAIPAALKAADNPTVSGDGWNGKAWDAIPANSQPDTLEAFVTSTAEDRTFLSTAVDYPNGDTDETGAFGETLFSFLGVDAASVEPNVNIGAGGFSDNPDLTFHIHGFVDIRASDDQDGAAPGIQTFWGIGNAHTFRFVIGGLDNPDRVNVAENDKRDAHFEVFGADPALLDPAEDGQLDFDLPGLYEVDLMFFFTSGFGIELHSSIPGTPNTGRFLNTNGILPTARMFSDIPAAVIPAPATLGLLALGGLGLIRRRRGRAADVSVAIH